ncbi:MAG TPA: CHASE2 domain-containing protein [Bryobacteraceae bacterium]|nr:CHASE2 domain-containing protein [Bryobacteraceae bacterium]
MASKLIRVAGYVAVVAGCFAIAMVAGWTKPAIRIDDYAYDLMLENRGDSWTPESVVVAIDEDTISEGHGMPHIREIETEVFDQIAQSHPRAVASDIILHDSVDEVADKRLAAALRPIRNLVLPSELVGDHWEDPLPMFKELAIGLGHVHLDITRDDGVVRQIPLEIVARNDTRWALALEAFRASRGDRLPPLQSPDDVTTAGVTIPTPRSGDERPLLIRYLRNAIPMVPANEIERHRDLLRDKTVFVGIVALSAAHDRPVNPFGNEVPGVAIHAQAYETIAHGQFLTPARDATVPMICAGIALLAGLIFALRSGWQAYVLGALLIGGTAWMPVEFFRQEIVFPAFAPLATAWLTTAGAAVFQHFFVRRALRKSESEKSRYQQAIHWVAHEMRTPLTAIQGSSEIMSRYSLPDAKRQELSEMINSESKRMARMIQTFLDIERLADGQMEMKRERFTMGDVASACFERARVIAERKKIGIVLDTSLSDANQDAVLVGDRELMEYALYNLLTNAIKYSSKETEIHVTATQRSEELRLSVTDQGMGMSAEELKKIFNKFYRTKGAEISGEAGTGIGLSIVEQIVIHHGGRMEVTSEPGKGSCFTMVLKAEIAKSSDAETAHR